ncbi:hypothetical protein UlMin_028058 [Ulmus minor]
MTQEFFQKYFPAHKTNNLKKQIQNFTQKDSDNLYQVWERFKTFLSSCPHHGFESWRVVSYFYDGILSRDRQFVESMCNGEFLQKEPKEAIDFLDDISEKSLNWNGSSALDSTNRNLPAGIYQLKEEDSLKARLETLTREIEVLKTKDAKTPQPVARVESQEPCFMCNGVDHLPKDYPTYFEMREMREHCNALGFPNGFNQQWQPNSNPSWRNNLGTQPTQWRLEATSSNVPQQSLSLEDSFKSFMQVHAKSVEEQGKINHRLLEEQQGVKEEQKVIKSQLTKLNNLLMIQEQGKLPSQTQPNPSTQNTRGANAITTQSGKVVDRPSPSTSQLTRVNNEGVEIDEGEPSIPLPFPQALKNSKSSLDHCEIIDQLKQVKVNLPLLHVIKKIHSYAKVIKDLCTIKRKHKLGRKTFLAEQVSAVIERETAPKFKDPGCPTVTCTIGENESSEALLDLGASVNLMPYSIYKQLGLRELEPTHIELQLADRSIRKPRGIIEDVLVQIGKFYYPVDFLVIDTHSRVELDSKVPLILGRPFLATANANIDCRNGLMNLTFGNMTLEVNIFYVGKPQVEEVSTCDQPVFVDTIEKEEEFEPLIEKTLDSFSFDNSYIDCTYHHAGNIFSSCDDVQLERITSWLPHDEHSMSFRVDAKEKEQIEEMPLKE